MKNYLISFSWTEDVNSPVAISIRSKIETIARDNWFQVFPNVVAIKSPLSIDDLLAGLSPVANGSNLMISEFVDFRSTEPRTSYAIKISED